MMTRLITNLLVLGFALPVSAEQETTIRVPISSEEIAELTFDPGRVSRFDVQRWMKFAENGPYSELLSIDTCSPDPNYVDCKEEVPSTHDGEVNLQEMRGLIAKLDQESYPPELSSVVAYLRRVQSFWLWKETQALEFIKTGQIAALSVAFDEVDPARTCSKPLGRIQKASSVEAWHLTQHEWSNCVWNAEQEKIGAYPRADWQSFLRRYGIRERVLSTVQD